MYLVDFFKRMIRKSNIPVLIYLVLNIFVISGFISFLFSAVSMPFGEALLMGVFLYAFSLLIALSPIGEWILRLQTGCRKIKRVEQINFIEPIFREVYEKAKKLDPSIPDDVQLYMNSDEDANAFATGRKTICITEGMLHMPEEQIKATLGHEFGHLAHKDTDLILIVSVGNLIVTAFILGIRLVIDFFHLIFGIICAIYGGQEGAIAAIMNAIYHAMITAIVAGLTWVWTKIGVLLVMKSSRANEYEADEFSFNLGYGNELCMLLNSITGSSAKGLFANLASSHPDKDDRIAKLQELGATYRATYGA
jgi:heat shock protein HtpX